MYSEFGIKKEILELAKEVEKEIGGNKNIIVTGYVSVNMFNRSFFFRKLWSMFFY